MEPKQKSILIAEDNWRLRSVLRACFCDRYRVVAVADGAALEEEIRQHHYDLVLTDLNLPQRCGADVVRQTGYFRLGPYQVDGLGVPTIVITGMDPEDSRYQAVRRLPHVLAVYQKPVDLQVLRDRVDGVLQAEEERAAGHSRALPLDSTHRVLLVDADLDTQTEVSTVLEQIGIQLRCTSSLTEAAGACQTFAFDVLLVGFIIGDDLADDLLAMLRKVSQTCPLPPVYILNELGGALSVEHFRPYPEVRGILVKPIQPEALRQAVLGVLTSASRGPHAGVA